MTEYPYVTVPGHLRDFMRHIGRAGGIPDKITYKYLKQSGFTSSNDRKIRDVLKFIGFVDSNYVPNDLWKAWRDKNRRGAALAEALRDNYKELFRTFPDAHRKDNEALTNFFRAHSDVGERALSGMVSTFKVLADLADFEAADETESKPERERAAAKSEPSDAEREVATQVTATRREGEGLTINLNIEIGLPATEDGEVYEKFFAAMKQHLLSEE